MDQVAPFHARGLRKVYPMGDTVDLRTASVRPLRVTIDEAGTTRVRDHLDVSAPIPGRFVPGAERVGDSVASATELGKLFPAPLDRSAQEQARAHLGALAAAEREASANIRVVQGAFTKLSALGVEPSWWRSAPAWSWGTA